MSTSTIYIYREAFRAFKQDAHKDFTAALALLADVRARSDNLDHFAEEALSSLRQIPELAGVDRLCLAQMSPAVPMLSVLSSANTQDLGLNQVPGGVHCFVSASGSLVSVREGRLRIYDDIQGVMASFAAQGCPPQRTIRRVSEMGLQSGLCLPLQSHGSRGLLFLNSRQRGYFHDITPATAVHLTQLAQICRSLLHPAAPGFDIVQWPVVPVRIEDFIGEFTWALAARCGLDIEVEVEYANPIDDSSWVWSPDLAIHALLETIGTAMLPLGGGLRLQLTPFHPHASRLEIEVSARAPRSYATFVRQFDLSQFSLRSWGIAVERRDSGAIALSLPIEPSFHQLGDSCYSI